MMWELIYADGRANEFEDNLVWRVADLLGVSSRERIELRQQVEAEAGAAEADAAARPRDYGSIPAPALACGPETTA